MQIENNHNLNIGRNIDAATTLAQPGTAQLSTQKRLSQAADSYTRNTGMAQIIEAEFVEAYTARTKTVTKPAIASATASETLSLKTETTSESTRLAFGSYNQPVNDGPLPGCILNLYA
jgi:hypothetical protein